MSEQQPCGLRGTRKDLGRDTYLLPSTGLLFPVKVCTLRTALNGSSGNITFMVSLPCSKAVRDSKYISNPQAQHAGLPRFLSYCMNRLFHLD